MRGARPLYECCRDAALGMAEEDGVWVCGNCQMENVGNGSRCEVCGENRSPKRICPAPSREATVDSQASVDSEGSLAWGGSEPADPGGNCGEVLESDVAAAKKVNEGIVELEFTLRPGDRHPQVVNLLVTPSKVVPAEACTAWGLKSKLLVRLGFDSCAAYVDGQLAKCTLLHPTAKGEGDADIPDAAQDGCIVAQQLQQLVVDYWQTGLATDPTQGTASVGAAQAGTSSATDLVPGVHRQDSRRVAQAEAAKCDGSIAKTVWYLCKRLGTLNRYCALCDEPHPFGAMMQPTVCQRSLCKHQFASFGSRLIGASSLATHAEVLDLLIATTTCAARSHRAQDIFEPFPTVPKEEGSDELALNPENRDLKLAQQVMSSFPTFEQLNAAAYGARAEGLRSLLNAGNPLCFGTFQWIIGSNRAHLVSIPPSLRLERLGTRHQFVMLSAPPERQAAFDELKEQHRTRFLWHGSAPENWHAILRSGLKNLSHTKLMTAGAAHGPGIYLATNATTSMSYAQMLYGGGYPGSTAGAGAGGGGGGGNAFLAGSDLKILALCEVVEAPSVNKHGGIVSSQPRSNPALTRTMTASAPHALCPVPCHAVGGAGRELCHHALSLCFPQRHERQRRHFPVRLHLGGLREGGEGVHRGAGEAVC